jgi:predicted RND superfamily exporter protein
MLALIAVFIFVFLDFRNLRDTLLATVPLVFGGAWLLEAMPLLGWEFNLANLFAVPIIIGMGVDNGVNMLYRWREERDKSSLILSTAVGKSVTVCSLTTIVAFAALITASHRGISSLGWVLGVGVTFILLATLIVLPAMFELLGSRIQRAEQETEVVIVAADGGPLIPEVVDPIVVEPPASATRSKSTGTDDA